MPRIRKQHLKKTFQFDVNRKRVQKTRTSTGKLKSKALNKFWENSKTVSRNAREMGLSADPNKTVPIPNIKQERLKIVKLVNGFVEEEVDPKKQNNFKPRKAFIAERLEKEANELRASKLKLPKGVVAELSYFLDKYQLNYRAMVKDRRNHNQYTWRQFRSKIRTFMGIAEQFGEYLRTRNLDLNSLDWEECQSEDDLGTCT